MPFLHSESTLNLQHDARPGTGLRPVALTNLVALADTPTFVHIVQISHFVTKVLIRKPFWEDTVVLTVNQLKNMALG